MDSSTEPIRDRKPHKSAVELLSEAEQGKIAALFKNMGWQLGLGKPKYKRQPGYLRAKRSADESKHRRSLADAKRARRQFRNLAVADRIEELR